MSMKKPDDDESARGGCTALVGVGLILAVSGVAWSVYPGELLDVLLSSQLTVAEKSAALRAYFVSFGSVAPAVYILAVTIEVIIAPLPGALLYAPGGLIFGGFWGGLYSLTGNVLGAAVSCQLIRTFGKRLLHRLVNSASLREVEQRVAQRGVLVIFLLRVNPLTSSDLVSYAAGLTPMPTWKLCVGTALGMAPLCWAQAYASERLLSAIPALIYPLAVLCVGYAVLAVFVLVRIAGKQRVGGCPDDDSATGA